MTAHQGKLIVIVAPSGTGKSTLIKRLLNEYPSLRESISCTTRPMREGEENGREYHFLTREEFEERRRRDDFLEWAVVHSNYYGTSKDFVYKSLESGSDLLFDLDVQGCDAMKEHFQEKALVIFIAPPSLKALEDRLYNRGTDRPEVIRERLKNAQHELTRQDDYDYKVLNDNLEQAYTDLADVVGRILKRG